jgi:hypothetical protein
MFITVLTKRPLLDPIPDSSINSTLTLFHFYIVLPLTHMFHSWTLRSTFFDQNSLHMSYMFGPPCAPWFYYPWPNNIWRRLRTVSHYVILSDILLTHFLLGLNILFSTLFTSNTLNLYSSVKMRNQISHAFTKQCGDTSTRLLEFNDASTARPIWSPDFINLFFNTPYEMKSSVFHWYRSTLSIFQCSGFTPWIVQT